MYLSAYKTFIFHNACFSCVDKCLFFAVHVGRQMPVFALNVCRQVPVFAVHVCRQMPVFAVHVC